MILKAITFSQHPKKYAMIQPWTSKLIEIVQANHAGQMWKLFTIFQFTVHGLKRHKHTHRRVSCLYPRFTNFLHLLQIKTPLRRAMELVTVCCLISKWVLGNNSWVINQFGINQFAYPMAHLQYCIENMVNHGQPKLITPRCLIQGYRKFTEFPNVQVR